MRLLSNPRRRSLKYGYIYKQSAPPHIPQGQDHFLWKSWKALSIVTKRTCTSQATLKLKRFNNCLFTLLLKAAVYIDWWVKRDHRSINSKRTFHEERGHTLIPLITPLYYDETQSNLTTHILIYKSIWRGPYPTHSINILYLPGVVQISVVQSRTDVQCSLHNIRSFMFSSTYRN